jgi:hypothetical protein
VTACKQSTKPEETKTKNKPKVQRSSARTRSNCSTICTEPMRKDLAGLPVCKQSLQARPNCGEAHYKSKHSQTQAMGESERGCCLKAIYKTKGPKTKDKNKLHRSSSQGNAIRASRRELLACRSGAMQRSRRDVKTFNAQIREESNNSGAQITKRKLPVPSLVIELVL